MSFVGIHHFINEVLLAICTQGRTSVWINTLGEMARFYRAAYSTQHMRLLQEVERGDLF